MEWSNRQKKPDNDDIHLHKLSDRLTHFLAEIES